MWGTGAHIACYTHMLRNRFLLPHRPVTFLRRSTFDAREWVARHVPPTPDALELRHALHVFHDLSAQRQRQVCELGGRLQADFVLLSMLLRKAPHDEMFRQIVNSKHVYATPLVEHFVWRLLDAGNLNAATSLLHVLLSRRKYSFSREMWSYFASLAAAHGHYAAAVVVYHEIIDPHCEEHHVTVPFLLLPTAIEALCVLYQQHGNAEIVQGLCNYFERFYSCFGHRDVYQTLCIARVETLLRQNDLRGALEAYNDLATKYRGYERYVDPKKAAHSLMHAVHLNTKHREESIEKHEKSDVALHKKRPPSTSMHPLFDGTIPRADLPSFYALLKENIGVLAKKSNFLDHLLALISASHYSINKVIVISLCELGFGAQAVAINNKMPSMLPFPPSRLDSSLFDEQFIALFRYLRTELETHQGEKIHLSLMASFRLCQSLHHKHFLYVTLLRAFVCAYVASPYAQRDELHSVLDRKVALDRESYARARALGVDPALVSDAYEISWQ